ncbi:hypothetical protein JCM8547_007006 [Rhodosporidiobolus lusitaniae]
MPSLPSSSRPTPLTNTPIRRPRAAEDQPPSSPFSASPPSLSRPPLAHLSPPHLADFAASSSSSSTATLNDAQASYGDLYGGEQGARSPTSPGGSRTSEEMSRSASSPSGKGKEREPVSVQTRRSSVGSLQGVIARDEARKVSSCSSAFPSSSSSSSARAPGNFDFLRRTGPRQTSGDSASSSLPPVEDDGAELSQLRWGTKWWPFAVVGPEGEGGVSIEGKAPSPSAVAGAPEPPTKDFAFLSLFAGKQTVEEAHSKAREQKEQDQLEAELLEASMDELQRRTRVPEADEQGFGASPAVPPKRMSFDDKGLPPPPKASPPSDTAKATSFLPSLFTSSPSSSAQPSSPPPAPPSLATSPTSASAALTSLTSLTTHAVESSSAAAAEQKSGPASLLSSITLSNPFKDFPSTSAGSLFSSAPFSSSSSSSSGVPRPPQLAHTRQFSSSSSIRRRSTGSSADADQREEGGENKASKSQVKGMVDEDDKEAVEEGLEENDDMFSVLKDKYEAPRLPLVFCHGLFGFDHLGPAAIKPLRFSYWIGVEEALQAMGCEVMIGRVPASASIEERAKVLCEMVGERFPGKEVNLVGHSMGGLDGRYLISRLKSKNFTVRSLTTISTPHRGSTFADYLLEDILGAEKVPAFLAVMRGLGVPGGGKAFDDLTTAKMAQFNEDTPDDPNVKYFSYGAEFTASWANPFYIPYQIIKKREGKNDGLVSVESAKWGEYLATLHNVNHLDLVGWTGKVRFSMAQLWGLPIKYRPISFYSSIAEMLAQEGF